MTSSHSRILANLSSKENMSPNRKRSSEEAFSSTYSDNVSKRRTVDSFMLPQTKTKLFSSKSSNKLTNKKQASIKNYYREGPKEKSLNKLKIFDENKENATKKIHKPKNDDAFSIMCNDEAPEKYWELLAEERRKGLQIALKENKELAEEILEKDGTIKELRTEVGELKETAQHAEYLASVLEELGKDCNVSSDSDNESENSYTEAESENELFDQKDISVSYPEEEPKESQNQDPREDLISKNQDENKSFSNKKVCSENESPELLVGKNYLQDEIEPTPSTSGVQNISTKEELQIPEDTSPAKEEMS